MRVTIRIPNPLAAQLTAAGKDPARAALEALAIEGYRSGKRTSGQIKRALGLNTRMQVMQEINHRQVSTAA